ncbi:MAG: hypothetical protein HOP15_07595 [Planctomycetes bacterium]|nr:hypothetical protein [Planctomycetota bacterium]
MPPAPGIGPTTGGSGGSPYTTLPRGPTSRQELKIAWQFPTYVEKVAVEEGRTAAVKERHALAAADAFGYLAGDDRRPLLVLRECLKCNGTDDALMNRQEDNERTLVMSRWFHCIKLPPDVLAEDHPFHVLFADEKPGHLFLARWDGSRRKDLTGQQSRTELWGLLESYLVSEYEAGMDDSLGFLLDLLDRFDRLDGEIESVKSRMDDQVEGGRADSSKMRKLKDKLAQLEIAKAKARAEAMRVSERKLKSERPVKAAAARPASGTQGG